LVKKRETAEISHRKYILPEERLRDTTDVESVVDEIIGGVHVSSDCAPERRA
jgi:hypothetical protein